MSTNPQVVVRGEAVLTVPPEIADVVVAVRVGARDRESALERCRARQAQVVTVVADAGDAVESSHTTGVSVYVEPQEHGAAHPVATVETRLVLGRLEVAGDLLVALGRLDDVVVHGPFWRLRPDSRAHEEARLAAIRDAVRRARLYAEAFGAQLTGLVEVADAGLSGGRRAARFAETADGVAAFEASGPRLELTPEQQQVHGSVEVRFAMSVPDPEVLRQ